VSEVRKGEPWGRPASGPADVVVTGSDADLARIAEHSPGARVEFVPNASSDLARSLGLRAAPRRASAARELPIDGLRLGPRIAVNAIVFGTAPDRLRRWSRSRQVTVLVDDRERFAGRATGVVIENGQYLHGADLVPRGHPGDGRVEVQVYALRPGERSAMRQRLPRGEHLPHPRIHTMSGTRVGVRVRGRMGLEIDGVRGSGGTELLVDVVPGILSVLV
jgi:YegS C-terminal NAD kinase beta sandwich-like domain